MKKIQSYIAILSLVLSLFLPTKSVSFASEIKSIPSVKESLPTKNLVTVTMAPLTVLPEVKVLNLQQASGCLVSSVKRGNLVQDTGSVNLNQPANCFSLSEVTNFKTVAFNLEVKTLAKNSQTVIVIKTKTNLTSQNYQGASIPSQNPILPVTTALVLMVLVLSKNKFSLKFLNLKTLARQSLTLHQLQVMRC